jgi:hypothetical protein
MGPRTAALGWMRDHPINPIEAEHRDVRQDILESAAALRRPGGHQVHHNGRSTSTSDDRVSSALFGSISSPRPSS